MKLPIGEGLLKKLLFYGYSGVDVFLLLSGYGLYVSLSRSDDLGGYLRRRAARLLPAYWPVCLVWLCTMIPAFGFSPVQTLQTIAGNVLMVGYLAGAPLNINWYPSCLLLTLLLAPCVYACLKNSRKPLRTLLLLLAAAFGVGISYFGNAQLLLFSRLPIFVLGMGLAMMERGKLQNPLRGAAWPVFLTVCFAGLIFVLTGYLTWMPTYLFERFDMDLSGAGFHSMFYTHLFAFFGVLLAGRLSDRLGRLHPAWRMAMQGFGLLAAVPFILLMGNSATLWVIYVGFAGFGFARAFFDANTYTVLYDVIPPRYHSSASSLMMMIGFGIGALAPVVLGAVKQAVGLSFGISMLAVVWLICGAGMVLGAKLFYLKDYNKIDHEQ